MTIASLFDYFVDLLGCLIGYVDSLLPVSIPHPRLITCVYPATTVTVSVSHPMHQIL